MTYERDSLWKVQLVGKMPFVGYVQDVDVDDEGNVVGVFVAFLCRMNGKIHPDYRKWRCLTPDLLHELTPAERKVAERTFETIKNH